MTLVLRIENFDQLDNGGPTWIRLEHHGASVGRRGSMDWVLPDPSKTISGHHFDIAYQDGGYWITDLSTNGTYPHGQRHRLAGPMQLSGGERFVVGHYVIVTELHAAEPAPAPAVSTPEPVYHPEPQPPVVEEDPWASVGDPLDPVEAMPPAGLSRPRFDDVGSDLIPVQRPGLQTPPASGGTGGLQVPRFPQDVAPQSSGIQAPEWTWGPAPLDEAMPEQPRVPEPMPTAPEAPYVPEALRPQTSNSQDYQSPSSPPQPAYQPTEPAAQQPYHTPPTGEVPHPPPALGQHRAPAPLPDPAPPPMEPRAVPQPSLEPHRKPPQPRPEPYAPPPLSMPKPEPAPQPPRADQGPSTAGGHDATAALRAFCEGAGLDPSLAVGSDAAAMMYAMGRTMRVAADEIMQMLRSRDDVKAFTRGGTRTMLGATANNPMKFLPDSHEALEAMFFNPRPGFMDGPEAFDDALKDVRLHQEAIFRALQPALREVFSGLSPDEIEAAVEGSGNLLTGGRKGRHWGVYVERWDAKAQVGENGILDAFLQAFARTYAQASARDGNESKGG